MTDQIINQEMTKEETAAWQTKITELEEKISSLREELTEAKAQGQDKTEIQELKTSLETALSEIKDLRTSLAKTLKKTRKEKPAEEISSTQTTQQSPKSGEEEGHQEVKTTAERKRQRGTFF